MGTFTPQVVLCCCLLFSAVVKAEDPPPMFVYRSDYRKPADIFAKGFEALGDNDSLEDHVSGSSCRTGTSTTAFVATTASENFAISWGRDRAILHSAATEFYVYKMRATENFYSAGASLREAYRKTGDEKYEALANHYEYQKEWLAVGGVPSSQIEMADVYSTPDKSGNVVRLRSEVNSNYDRTIQGSGNPKPYIPKARPTRRRFRLPNFVTACFTGNGGHGTLSTVNTAKNRNAEAKISIASLLRTWKNLLQHAS